MSGQHAYKAFWPSNFSTLYYYVHPLFSAWIPTYSTHSNYISDCSKNHFSSRWNKLHVDRFCMCPYFALSEQLTLSDSSWYVAHYQQTVWLHETNKHYWKWKLTLLWPSVCTATNMADTTRRTIKTQRLETKRTDLPWPLLRPALITKPLFAI